MTNCKKYRGFKLLFLASIIYLALAVLEIIIALILREQKNTGIYFIAELSTAAIICLAFFIVSLVTVKKHYSAWLCVGLGVILISLIVMWRLFLPLYLSESSPFRYNAITQVGVVFYEIGLFTSEGGAAFKLSSSRIIPNLNFVVAVVLFFSALTANFIIRRFKNENCE